MNYTLTVDSKVVDSSQGREPLTYVQGAGQIIPGLEEKMKGLKKGNKKRITVSPGNGYGFVNPDAYQNVSRKSFKNIKELKIGTIVNGQMKGRPVQAKVISIDKENVILDLNHPLAGKTLQFDIEVLEIKP